MLTKLRTLGLAVTLVAVPLLAQRRGGSPPDPAEMIKMRVAMLTSRLELTPAQQTQATEIFTKAQTASEALRTNMKANRTSFAEAIKNNDTTAIENLSKDGGALEGQLMAIQGKSDAAFYAILTADQKTKYDAMPHRGPGGGGMGPGRFGPGGNRARRDQ